MGHKKLKPTEIERKNAIKNRMRQKIANKQGPKKICLTMIVKNESKNMPRVLNSAKPVVDMISIVDTGSTDDTEKIILDWGKENNIPTTVHHEPFKNFAHNRTHSIKAAKLAYPDADYFLLSDADFVWEVDKGSKFDKTLLIDHKYLIEQYNKALSYWNIRLLSAKVDWECIGVTHEYWAETKNQTEYVGEIRTTKIKTLIIDDKEDGGCKADKFTRDERLLRSGLEDPNTPENLKTRYKFYLAQTLKDMGRFYESIEWYTKRAMDKGWVEEVYYAKFQIGFNYEQLGWKKKKTIQLMGNKDKTPDDEKFIATWNSKNLPPSQILAESTQHFTDASVNYLAAYKYRKTRAEALYYLVRMYRNLGMNENAYELAQIGSKIVYPVNDTLFIERGCYDYLFDFELSIVCFHIPEKKDEGRAAISRLIGRDDIPEWLKTATEKNSRAYI